MSKHIAWLFVSLLFAFLLAGIVRGFDRHDAFARCMKSPTGYEEFCNLVVQGEP